MKDCKDIATELIVAWAEKTEGVDVNTDWVVLDLAKRIANALQSKQDLIDQMKYLENGSHIWIDVTVDSNGIFLIDGEPLSAMRISGAKGRLVFQHKRV